MQWSLILLFLMGQTGFISCQLHQYYYVGERKTWTEAQQYCREKYSDLATVSNMTDMKTIMNKSSGKAEAWIGLHDPTNGTRTWYWSLPGVEFSESETNWASGEPDDKGQTANENCGFADKDDLTWGDTLCSEKRYCICYDEKNSQKYFLYKEEKSWLEAQSYCRETHTDLISGLNQLQDGQLKNMISSADKNMFMGLFRDSWRWSDGRSSSFRHWNLQFNNENINSGRCAMTEVTDGGRWKTDSCATEKPFICYDDEVILIPENKTWEEALSYCRVYHHDLVTITNLDEQRWVQEKVKQASTPFVWMGLHYACTLDLWFWVSDEVVRYKNWVSDGQMDQCDMSGAMETGGQHQWVKRNDAEEFNFICSKH